MSPYNPPTPVSADDPAAVAAACAAHGLVPAEFAELRTRAAAAKDAAYCPYSKFRVGACLLTASGDYVPGANVENASFPVGTCAERVAFATALVSGRHRSFRAVAVAADTPDPCSPCGMCRQFIREFCDLSIPIIMFDRNGKFIVLKLEVLLPLSFGPDALK